jgi:hypothetical protein
MGSGIGTPSGRAARALMLACLVAATGACMSPQDPQRAPRREETHTSPPDLLEPVNDGRQLSPAHALAQLATASSNDLRQPWDEFPGTPLALDSDGDSIDDEEDPCPSDPINDPDGDGVCTQSPDVPADNCPTDYNPEQADSDGDDIGDACDHCPGYDDLALTSTDDMDNDGIIDLCDLCLDDAVNDPDGDWLCADAEPADNCPYLYNPSQADWDGDGIGDACDNCVTAPNGDCPADLESCDKGPDGILDDAEEAACVAPCDVNGDGSLSENERAVGLQIDTESDGIGDACDNCPDALNLDQVNTDGDAFGNECDDDDDNDERTDSADDCPLDPRIQTFDPALHADTDGDDIPDLCDGDRDNDGLANYADNCDLVANGDCTVDLEHCDTEPPNDALSDSEKAACEARCDVDGDGSVSAGELATAFQANHDGDGGGDACDPDDDNDRVCDPGGASPSHGCVILSTGPDFAPLDPLRCGDEDADGCDDCAYGFGPMRGNDGPDLDHDGICDSGDQDADGDGVCQSPATAIGCEPGVTDADDASKHHCADSDIDTCDDCVTGAFDPANDGLDTGGTPGICNAGEPAALCAPIIPACDLENPDPEDSDCDTVPNVCDNCPTATNENQADQDDDSLGDACDPCPFSDDNTFGEDGELPHDRDGDGRCLIQAELVANPPDAAAVTDEHTEPAIGIAGQTPYVAYQTITGTIAIVAIFETGSALPPRFEAVLAAAINPVDELSTSHVSFRASQADLVVAPRAALTDEADYYAYPYGGLYAVPFRVTATPAERSAWATIVPARATFFDCYGGRYGAPGIATLDRFWLGNPSPWIVAQVTCPTYSAFAGSSNRRVLLGGGIDAGPVSIAGEEPGWSIGPRDPIGTILFGDDRMGATGNQTQALFALSSHDPFVDTEITAGFSDWHGNLSPSGDAAAVRVEPDSWQVLVRTRPTSRLRPEFSRLTFLTDFPAFPEFVPEAVFDNRLVLWSEPERVRGRHPSSGVRVGFDAGGDTFAAQYQVIARHGPNGVEIWRWWYEDTCPDDNSPEVDTDGDGIGDACDLCPSLATRSQSDLDSDGIGDDCDLCPYHPAAVFGVSDGDEDNDGRGDACDPTVIPSPCDPDDLITCSVVEAEVRGDFLVVLCRDGGRDRIVAEIPIGEDGVVPPLEGWTFVPPADGCRGKVVPPPGPPTPEPCKKPSLMLPAVDADGRPACDAAALPICVAAESRLDFERPLLWSDHCVDAYDQPGAVFNYPGEAVICRQEVTTTFMTPAGEISCTMVPIDTWDPAAGCYYEVGGTCAISASTMHPEDRPPYLTGDPGFAICATGDVLLQNAFTVTDSLDIMAGNVAAGGDLTLQNASSIFGSVLVGQDLSLRNASYIGGDATVAGTMTVQNASRIDGTITQPAPWPGDICTCGRALADDMAFIAQWNDNARLTAVAGPYLHDGVLELTNTQRLTLESGDYLLAGLRLRNASVLQVAPGARVRLYVTGPISMENATTLNSPPATGARVDIVSDYAGTHRLVNASDSVILVYAPYATLNLRNAAAMFGGVTAGSLLLENAGYLVRELNLGDDGTLVQSCQWVSE